MVVSLLMESGKLLCSCLLVYVGEADSVTETEVCEGKFQLVYLSPEALLT